jgi:hypothetical protein
VTDDALGVNQVFSWPIVIRVGGPRRQVVIDRYGVFHTQVLGGTPDVADQVFEGEFWRLNTDDV